MGAASVTLDLNGHTIDGDHTGFDDLGIDNSAGEDAVTVKGPGIVREFANGVSLANASDNVVRDIEASHNYWSGIRLEGGTATGNQIVHNVVFENYDGVSVTDDYAQNVEAGSNTVRGNTAYANFHGILLGGYGDANRIEHELPPGRTGLGLSSAIPSAQA